MGSPRDLPGGPKCPFYTDLSEYVKYGYYEGPENSLELFSNSILVLRRIQKIAGSCGQNIVFLICHILAIFNPVYCIQYYRVQGYVPGATARSFSCRGYYEGPKNSPEVRRYTVKYTLLPIGEYTPVQNIGPFGNNMAKIPTNSTQCPKIQAF